LNYQANRNNAILGSWICLVLSGMPLVAMAAFNSVVGHGLIAILEKLSRPLAAVLSPPLAIGLSATLYACIPPTVGLVFAWTARRGFRTSTSKPGRIGKFLAWSSFILNAGVVITVLVAVLAAYWIMQL